MKARAGDGEEPGHDELGNDVTDPAQLAHYWPLVPGTSPAAHRVLISSVPGGVAGA